MEMIVILAVLMIGGGVLLGGLVGWMIFKMWEELADK